MPRVALVIYLSLAFASGAYAHSLGAECKIHGGKVELEAYFSDDTPAANAKIAVHDMTGKLLADGTTDNDGRWSFPVPPPGRYDVIVDAGAGHKTTVPITVPDTRDQTEARVSTGPSRGEFTRTPWLPITFGLIVIAAAGLGLYLWLQRSRATPLPPATSD